MIAKLAIHYEIEPTSKREKLIDQFLKLKGLIDKLNVPENPLGQLKPASLAISILAKEMGIEPVMHLRAADRNLLSLASELYGAIVFDIKDVLIVRGDIKSDQEQKVFNKYRLDEIVEIFKKEEKLSKINIGLPLTKFDLNDELVKIRLASKADFLVTLQINNPSDIPIELIESARKAGKKIQSYYMLISKQNMEYLQELGFNVRLKSEVEYLEEIAQLEQLLDGVILSCPRDFHFLLNILHKYRKR